MSVPTPVDTSPAFTRLPVELHHRIIICNLPPAPTTTFRHTYKERYSQLLKLALVNKVYASLVREVLLRHVWIQDMEGVNGFDDTVERSRGSFEATRSLWLDNSRAAYPRRPVDLPSDWVESMVQGHPRLRSLYLGSSEKSFEIRVEVPGLAMSAPSGLTDLVLKHCKISFGGLEVSPTFHHLRRLTLILELEQSSGAHFLNSCVFPQLDSLSVITGEGVDEHLIPVLTTGILRLAPQLKTLAFSASGNTGARQVFPSALWGTFKSLRSLVLDLTENLSAIVHALPPSTITSLRLRAPLWRHSPRYFHSLHDAFIQNPPSLHALAILELPPPEAPPASDAGRVGWNLACEQHAAIVVVGAERGIEVIVKEGYQVDPRSGDWEDWEDNAIAVW